MGRGQRYGHGDRVWINRGGGLTEGTIIEVLGETEYLVAVDGQGVTEIQESAIAPREATDHPVPVRITPAGDGFHAAKVRQLAELASLEERYRHELMDD